MKVGDYVRTNDGYINKIKKVNQWNVLVDARDLFGEEINIANNEIVKSSPNIIDLIEAGDYVNGEKIDSVLGNEELLTEAITNAGIDGRIINSSDIETVVTKEQFESMEYKIGSE